MHLHKVAALNIHKTPNIASLAKFKKVAICPMTQDESNAIQFQSINEFSLRQGPVYIPPPPE